MTRCDDTRGCELRPLWHIRVTVGGADHYLRVCPQHAKGGSLKVTLARTAVGQQITDSSLHFVSVACRRDDFAWHDDGCTTPTVEVDIAQVVATDTPSAA